MKKCYLVVIFFILTLSEYLISRSIHRKPDDRTASITVKFKENNDSFNLTDYRLREFPLFKTYNTDYINSKRLPKDTISYMYEKDKSVESSVLENLMEKILKEVNEGKRDFPDFKILKDRDFNYKKKCGLMVLKFKDYPFIFKLFIECPKNFTKPDSRSFQVRGVFILGGSFRHVMGFTRLRNIDLISEKIKHTKWEQRVKMPRKWFWTPKDNKIINISTQNLGQKQEIDMPAIYGLICDEIKEDNKKDSAITREYLRLCSDLEFILDPLPSNFKLGDDGKIILIDTEHFSTLIGINRKFKYYDKYSSYWMKIMGKYIKDAFGTNKKHRREKQQNIYNIHKLFN